MEGTDQSSPGLVNLYVAFLVVATITISYLAWVSWTKLDDRRLRSYRLQLHSTAVVAGLVNQFARLVMIQPLRRLFFGQSMSPGECLWWDGAVGLSAGLLWLSVFLIFAYRVLVDVHGPSAATELWPWPKQVAVMLFPWIVFLVVLMASPAEQIYRFDGNPECSLIHPTAHTVFLILVSTYGVSPVFAGGFMLHRLRVGIRYAAVEGPAAPSAGQLRAEAWLVIVVSGLIFAGLLTFWLNDVLAMGWNLCIYLVAFATPCILAHRSIASVAAVDTAVRSTV